MQDDLPPFDETALREAAERIQDREIARAAAEAEDLRRRFNRPGPLGKFVSSGELMIAMLRDYWGGEYDQVPRWVIGAIAIAAIYLLNPLDIVPDYLPFAGQIDDVLVVTACLMLIDQQLQEYKEWKLARLEKPGEPK